MKKDRLSGWVSGMSRRGPKSHTLMPDTNGDDYERDERDCREVQQARRSPRAPPPPTAGSSQPTIQLLSSQPTDRRADTQQHQGHGMTSGDSWGCTPCRQRLAPKKVINISRVM